MCGLMYLKSLDGRLAGPRLWKRYEHQKTRGTEGYGFIEIGKPLVYRAQHEAEAKKLIDDCHGTEILFHHRKPTSTVNVVEATHPIVIKHKTLKSIFYVIHNGVISNPDELKKKHEALGFKYRTVIKTRNEYKTVEQRYYGEWSEEYNDSEALAHELALYFAGKQTEIEANGSIAFICLETDKKGKPLWLHYGHNALSPLFVEHNNNLLAIKSAGGGKEVPIHKIYSISYTGKQEAVNDVVIGTSYLAGDDNRTWNWNNSGRVAGYKTGGYTYRTTEERLKELEDWKKTTDDKIELMELEMEELREDIDTYREYGDMAAVDEANRELKTKQRQHADLLAAKTTK